MKRELTPENIQELKENQIFVFGSNMNGNHAGGAARLAVEKFGAIMGQAEGIQGQSYAIPTLDKDMQKVTEEELVVFLGNYNPQIQISAESETKRSIFREKDKTKRSKKESAQHSKSRNKSFVMTSVSAL